MAEKEYIEREAMLARVDAEFFKTDPSSEEQLGFLKCRRIIRELPAADVAPVVHAEWMQNPYCKRIFYCSECGGQVEDGSYNPNPSEHFPYCHCGAKMDGERKEATP